MAATLLISGALGVALLAQGGQAPKEHTMTGCLQKGAAADTFIVNNTAEKGPKTIGIVESKANLAPHVGHKIDITGVAVPNAEAESMKPAPPKADHYMRLSAIKMVSATCP
jgi:hypothetical protein